MKSGDAGLGPAAGTGCAGSGCTDALETYVYNNRLQPVMIELGNTSNASADYCLVYNYYPNVGNPSSRAVPAQGGYNGGDVIGIYDQDNVNSSLSHTEAYTYDALNRLSTAVATGNLTYNLTFEQGSGPTYVGYDRYGNMTCVINGNTNGPCAGYSFDPNTNRITNSGFSYDASGNLTAPSTQDGNFTYGYDAEGRMVSAGGRRTASFTYTAWGWLAETSDTRYREEFLYGPAGEDVGDLDGQAGAWWDERIPFAGRRTLADDGGWYPPSGNATVFSHINQVESATAFTNYSGSLVNERLYYPWGHYWTQIGHTMEEVYGGITDEQELYAALQRRQDPALGRWLSPDPLGGDIANPQSLNRYAYVFNNPTTLTDPLGLGNCNPQPHFSL